ncbi:MAG TPA: nucleoside hydrolase [Thermoanaerobaculia bacterium]|nr:nucleoside hydrolase [Thermoanaerobaculia bacterium]
MKLRAHVLILFVCVVLTGIASAATPRKRVIISTDMGLGLTGGWRSVVDVDDGWALPMALHERSLDVKLVATVLGNSNVAAEQLAADKLLRDVLRSNVKRVRGAAVRLDDPQATLNGTPITADCRNAAVDAMSDVLRRGKATIIAIGPLTDVACLALNAPPHVVRNIDEVIAIMGRAPHEEFAIGPVSSLTDFNLVMDPRAARVLLDQSTVPMTFLQFKLTSNVLVPRTYVQTLAGGTRLQQYVHDWTIGWIDSWHKTFGEDGFHPWDSNAVWYAVEPSAFSCRKVHYKLQPCAKDATDPYNRLGGCAGHRATQKTSLDRESLQLWLGRDVAPSREVNTCDAYRSPEDRALFEQAVRAFLGAR